MTIIGIDPGKSGGVAWLVDPGIPVANAWPLPHTKSKDIDIPKLLDIIKYHTRKDMGEVFKIYIEDTQYRGGNCAKGDKTRYTEHGKICGGLEALGIPYVLVNPNTWQHAILGNFEKGKSKEAAWEHVETRYSEIIDCHRGKSKPHDGMVDALCIAEYGWMEENL
jgi:crossover junction endodeoxyribonuclease RuvC